MSEKSDSEMLVNDLKRELAEARDDHMAAAKCAARFADDAERLEGVVRAVAGWEGEPGHGRPDLLWWKQCQAAAMLALAKNPSTKASGRHSPEASGSGRAVTRMFVQRITNVDGLRIDTETIVHVLPVDDLREHTCSLACWCAPIEDDGVIIHNSMDRREDFESGGRKQS